MGWDWVKCLLKKYNLRQKSQRYLRVEVHRMLVIRILLPVMISLDWLAYYRTFDWLLDSVLHLHIIQRPISPFLYWLPNWKIGWRYPYHWFGVIWSLDHCRLLMIGQYKMRCRMDRFLVGEYMSSNRHPKSTHKDRHIYGYHLLDRYTHGNIHHCCFHMVKGYIL